MDVYCAATESQIVLYGIKWPANPVTGADHGKLWFLLIGSRGSPSQLYIVSTAVRPSAKRRNFRDSDREWMLLRDISEIALRH